MYYVCCVDLTDFNVGFVCFCYMVVIRCLCLYGLFVLVVVVFLWFDLLSFVVLISFVWLLDD